MAGPVRVWNPPNPYLTEQRELLGEPPATELEVYEDSSRSALTSNDSPDVGFHWSVNPYRGCFHACAYCYARPTHEYLGLGAGTDFDRKIFVKKNAPALLEQAFRKRSWKGELVAFSGVTDCYQPLEAGYRLTRSCLTVCLSYRNPAAVITKSALVRRDVDVLAALAKEAFARVLFSIPFIDEDAARLIEPGAASIRKRFETMEILAKAGIPVGIGIAPVIPGLNDSSIPALLKEARSRGATTAFHQLLRLPGSVQEVFLHRVREAMPMRAGKIERQIRAARGGGLNESRFGLRHQGKGKIWDAMEQTWNLWTRKLGFNEDRAAPADTFRRPPEADAGPQMELFALDPKESR
ncbi:MAG: PA0069 family radical SAM protein [Elusimicrobia bacterium]|nr:PA0069 family radical SAM protein [Elusimicrobiota bacterium]